MDTNGFAVFLGPDARLRAESSLARVHRYALSGAVGSLQDIPESYAIAFALEPGRIAAPLIHGFLGEGHGEFAVLKKGPEGLAGGRDRLGTRALYVDSGWTCVATDHRVFTERPRLFPRGCEVEFEGRKVNVSELVPETTGLTLDEAAERLASLLTTSVRARVSGRKKVAVSFSGGLDSSVIAHLAAKETQTVLCSAFASGSRDETEARKSAEALGLEFAGKELGREEVASLAKTVELPFRAGPMDTALWSLYSTTARMASEAGAQLILLGQLADEVFGGYMKYALTARRSPQEAEAMMRNDVAACGEGAFIRDELACGRFTEVRFPFADEALVSFGLGLPLRYKVSEGERKVVLRRAARTLGLPESIVNAPKKAAQYSSGIAKLVPEGRA